ncbi:MBL fold metallo-hydrolase [Tellurirhabdus bombi]|uniref:MBL fold metallo-hydrolase n=1 Tax=Tellurirhabdus bombi TaxID=2907205 RepID=UPI001F2B4458|nr:MBL fold metallo-hydrolase [Tellurirhabdus bombi]
MFSKLLIGLAILIAILLIVGIIGGYLVSAPRYSGPVTDHFDGKTFRNLNGQEAKGFREAIAWTISRKQMPWEDYRNGQPATPPPARVTGKDVRVTFVNHSTVLMQFDGLNVLTDPVWYTRTSPFQWVGPKRHTAPGVSLNDLPKIDIILLSHNHWDHLDIGTFKTLCQRDQPKVYCTLGVKTFLEEQGCQNISEMDWNQSIAYNSSTKVHCVPAQHFSGRGLFDRNATLWAGFVIQSAVAGNVYFAGDSGYGAFFKQIGQQFGPLRLALIPIGAYKPEWFMSPIHCSPAEAVQIHQDVRSEHSIGIHFGTFALADDGENEPVNELNEALRQKGLSLENFRTLKEGGSTLIP